MPNGCHKGKEPLTWDELGKLKDRTPIHVQTSHMEKPYSCVLRWELPKTACICAFDPGTGDDTHVLSRLTQEMFERKQMKIWARSLTADEIVASEPQMTSRESGMFYWEKSEENSNKE